MSDCCKSGFLWNGTPVGKEATLGKNKTYVTGSNKDVAIMIVHDVFGWTLPNLRLLADHFAKEADATVYLPDFYDGDVVSPETMDDPKKREAFDLMGFIGKHAKDIRGPEIFDCAKELKKQYKKVGAIGYCWGAWAVLQLAGKDAKLIDAGSVAHPSLVEQKEVENMAIPMQFLAPENDPMFTPELKDFTTKTLPTLGIDYDYQYFAGLNHGFAVRGDPKNEAQKEGLERAKNAAVDWFKQFLH